MTRQKMRTSRAFTLVELLVVIAIIAILVIMLLPALGAVRELARRSQCENHAMQLAMGLQQYELAHEAFPSGVIDPAGPIESRPSGIHQGWIGQLLPYIGHTALYERLDKEASVYAEEHVAVRTYRLTELKCPSDGADSGEWPASNYAGNHHDVEAPIDENNHGVLFLNSRVVRDEIPDGPAYTLLFAEKLHDTNDLGWLSGTRATLRNTGTPINGTPRHPPQQGTSAGGRRRRPPGPPSEPAADSSTPSDPADKSSALDFPPRYVGGFGSTHPGGLMAGMANGSVRFASKYMDSNVWQQLGHRSDATLLDESAFD